MEIARFLSRYPPFDSLTIDENERIGGQLQIEFFPKGSTILRQAGEPAAFMYIVRKGSVELTSDGVVFDQLLEGECFGHPSLLSGLGPAFNVAAVEDTLCYLIHREEVKRLLATGAGLTFLAESLRHRTERVFEGHVQTAFDRSMTHVGSLLHRPPVICDSAASIQTAAELMRREHISSVVVPWKDKIGVMTDRDLRSRVVAPGRDPAEPVAAVMSFPARTIDEEATVAEVLLLMLEIGVHHLPVLGSDGTLIGVVTDTDLMGLGLQAPFAIRNAIERAEDLGAAVAAMRRLPGAVTELLDASVDPLGIGHTSSPRRSMPSRVGCSASRSESLGSRPCHGPGLLLEARLVASKDSEPIRIMRSSTRQEERRTKEPKGTSKAWRVASRTVSSSPASHAAAAG